MSVRKPSSSPAQATDEAAFIKQHLASLAQLRTAYPADYVPPLTDLPRRAPVVPIEVPAPPEKAEPTSLESDTINITIKSLKPALSFPLTISPLDPISTLKSQLSLHPRAPPADAQRLLLKGKALVDTRLVKEYGLEEGSTVMLMVKPGAIWTGEARSEEEAKDEGAMDVDSDLPAPTALSPQLTPGGHPIPTLTLSTEVPSRPTTPGQQPPPSQVHTIPINTDISTQPQPGPQPDAGTSASYHSTISSEQFWSRLLGFLKLQFEDERDAEGALEQFLLASKGALSVDEIARIRDAVGVVGMGGRGM